MDPLTLALLMGGASAIGTIAQGSAAKKQAEAMMPEEYQKRLKQLEAQQRAGTLGLSDAQRTRMEAAGTAGRAGLTAQAQAQNLQQASAASGAALSGRDLFQKEIALQQTMAKAQSEEAKAISEADRQAREEQKQMMLELQQRQADAEAARKMANRQMIAGLAGAAVTTGAAAYGGSQMNKGFQAMQGAAVGSDAYKAGAEQMFKAQMAMGMAGAFGGSSMRPVMPAMPAGTRMPATGGLYGTQPAPVRDPMPGYEFDPVTRQYVPLYIYGG